LNIQCLAMQILCLVVAALFIENESQDSRRGEDGAALEAAWPRGWPRATRY
jgi:hypothetical protein